MAQEGAGSPRKTAPAPEPAETPAHYCQEHQTSFKRYSRGESIWWSHKTAEGKWRREEVGSNHLYTDEGPLGSLWGLSTFWRKTIYFTMPDGLIRLWATGHQQRWSTWIWRNHRENL